VNLLRALAAAGVEATCTEWERSSPSSPAYAAGFGSPTVLVEGHDVAGENPTQGISCCRLYASAEGRRSGAPSPEFILSFLMGRKAGTDSFVAGVREMPNVMTTTHRDCDTQRRENSANREYRGEVAVRGILSAPRGFS
jgi:hypothetical protein